MPETTITITLKPLEGEEVSATLLIQRGELAQLRQFVYNGAINSIAEAIGQALHALAQLEAAPPVVPPEPEPQPEKPAPRAKPQPDEPRLDIPSKRHKRGAFSVPMSHISIVQGETDAAAYRQAIALAGRLYDAKLWDGQTPLRLLDVHASQRKIRLMSDAELGKLYQLTDFIQPENTN